MNMTAMAGPMNIVGGSILPKRRRSSRIPKAMIVLACIVGVMTTIAVGFTWGGWVTSTKAAGMASQASSTGQAKLAATICADRFMTASNAGTQTALLQWTETAQRGDFIRQGGWLTLPGMSEPVAGAADLCVRNILSVASSVN